MKTCLTMLCAGFSLAATCAEISGPVQKAEFAVKPEFAAPPALRGIDFWKDDAMHVPASPVANLMPNPSFRQGMRYYFRMWGGNLYREPEKAPRYEIVGEGRRPGTNALLIRTGEQVLPGTETPPDMMSFPMPLEPGKSYVLSCYAKSDLPEGAVLTFCMTDTGQNFSFRTPSEEKSRHPLTDRWQRIVYPFHITKAGPECVNLNGNGKPPFGTIWVTDIQLEEGDKPTEFTEPPVEGLLTTADPTNTIDSGSRIGARFELFGNAPGKVELTLFDYWRKKVWNGVFPLNPARKIDLPFDSLDLGKGSFCLQAKYVPEAGTPWYDYYRFSVISPILDQKSPTRNFYGASFPKREFNRNLLTRQMVRAGYGNATYSAYDPMQLKLWNQFGIENQVAVLAGNWGMSIKQEIADPELRKELGWLYNLFTLKEITLEDEKRLEEAAYRFAKLWPYEKRWALSNESECHTSILKEKRYEEWSRAAAAAYRGFKRADPNLQFFPDTGTSCYLPHRGWEVTEAHIREGAKKGIQYDFIGLHPYAVLDGARWTSRTYLLDDMLAHLFDVLKKYNYPENTPVYVTESFNNAHLDVPEWGTNGSADSYPITVKPSYDFSRDEVSHAAWAARLFLTYLKYWPRIPMAHMWSANPWHDITGNMIPVANAVNTLRVLFPDPRFVTNFRPAAGVHVYVYREKDGKTIAAVWTSREEVELHQVPGVRFDFKFRSPDLELIDLMGNRHAVKRSPDGDITLILNAAPLFLVAKEGEEKELISALEAAKCSPSADSCKVTIAPDAAGGVRAVAENQENVECRFTALKRTTAIPPHSARNIPVVPPAKMEFGRLFRTGLDYRFQYPGLPENGKSMCLVWFYVPYAKGKPDWSKIPSLEVPHRAGGWTADGKDFSAKCQMAWNEKGLYLRVTAEDSEYAKSPDYNRTLENNASVWNLDNGMELYLDYAGIGKSSATTPEVMDYYRYDFAPGNSEGKSGRGFVYRRQEPNMQLMGGTDAPTKAEAAAGIPCEFTRTAAGYVYTIEFPHRYLMPMVLKPGTHAGFAISLIDIDTENGKQRSRRLCFTESGLPNQRMSAWASIILVKDR